MKYIGKSERTEDALEKVTGRKKYAEDLTLPGLLYGKILFSPIAHGKIRQIDVTEAESLPGVHAVITYKDSPDVYFNSLMRMIDDDKPATEKVLDSTVRFVGDKVAAVAAETEAIAEQALSLIKVEYETLPHVLDVEEALAEDAYPIYPEGNKMEELYRECGSVEQGFLEADFIVEHKIKTPLLHHGAIEPYVVMANWDPENTLTIWGPQQGVYSAQVMLSKIFGLTYNKIQVINTTIGGTFGGKEGLLLEPIATLLSKKSKRPVRIRLSRKESIYTTHTRHASTIYSRLGVKKDGTMTAYSTKVYLNVGPYCSTSLYVRDAMCGKIFKLYSIPNIAFHGIPVYTNSLVGGAMRGYGSPQLFASLEILVEEAAKKIGMDGTELRQLNFINPYDKDPISGLSLGNAQVKTCMLRGKEAFGWNDLKNDKKEDESYYYGHGVAATLHGNGVAPFFPDMTAMTLSLNDDGSAILSTSICDHGGGSYTMLKKIIGEILFIESDLISLVKTDTKNAPYDYIAGASRNTWVGGSCAIKLANSMKKQLLECAAAKFNVEAEAVALKDGIFQTLDGTQQASRKEVIYYGYMTLKTKFIITEIYSSKSNAGSYGVHFAKVKVHKKTGVVIVTDYVAACDVGKALNPMLLEGQVEGAIQMGLGMALSEEIKLAADGTPLNTSFKTYKMPKARNMPEKLKVLFVEEGEPDGPYGAKSIGEASVNPVAPAIVNAICNALETTCVSYPFTPKQILEKIKNKAQ